MVNNKYASYVINREVKASIVIDRMAWRVEVHIDVVKRSKVDQFISGLDIPFVKLNGWTSDVYGDAAGIIEVVFTKQFRYFTEWLNEYPKLVAYAADVLDSNNVGPVSIYTR